MKKEIKSRTTFYDAYSNTHKGGRTDTHTQQRHNSKRLNKREKCVCAIDRNQMNKYQYTDEFEMR